MTSNLIIGVIILLLFFVMMFYLFRWFLRKFIKNHNEGKNNSLYKLFIICGITVFIFSLFWYFNTKVFITNSTIIEGKVIKIIKENLNTTKDYICFRPTFYYIDPIVKQKKTMISKVCSNPQIFNLGDKVELLVNLNKPNNTPIENEWFALWGGATVLATLSILFNAFGMLGILLYKYKIKKS